MAVTSMACPRFHHYSFQLLVVFAPEVYSAILALLAQGGYDIEITWYVTGIRWAPSSYPKCTWVTFGMLVHSRLTEQIFRAWCR